MPQVLPLRDLVIPSKSLDVIAPALARAALAAGPAVMEEYARESSARSKADGSPVTAADERAEEIIRECLTRVAPTTPIVAEEAAAAGCPLDVGARFFLVDPLDGTREFLARNGEFTINIALIDARAPVAGAVYAPAIGRLWFAGESAFSCEAPVGGDLPDETLCRRLSALRADDGMGYRGGRRGVARGGRDRARRRRRTPRLRQGGGGATNCRICGVGRRELGARSHR
jgi:fructose-1,6-bisphosphatase/inositol monophosphatase family enzyme